MQPDVTVATVVVRDVELLCVEEHVNGQLVINQPAGHLEPDESLVDAALRETCEETGWDVRLSAFIGASGVGCIRSTVSSRATRARVPPKPRPCS